MLLHRSECEDGRVTSNVLQEVLRRARDWPKSAQVELAEIALEIDARLCGGPYHATPGA